jgi:ribosomal protein S18 acetylase RimI-like enzyme
MSNGYSRPAIPADAPAVERVARESWHAAYDDFLGEKTVNEVIDEWYDLDALRDAADNDEHVFVVAETDDISGFAHAAFNAERDHWMLIRIYVLPDRWGDGIGTALLEDVEVELTDRDVSTYELAVLTENDVGVSFYESRGFERVEIAETELAGIETTEYWYQKTL